MDPSWVVGWLIEISSYFRRSPKENQWPLNRAQNPKYPPQEGICAFYGIMYPPLCVTVLETLFCTEIDHAAFWVKKRGLLNSYVVFLEMAFLIRGYIESLQSDTCFDFHFASDNFVKGFMRIINFRGHNFLGYSHKMFTWVSEKEVPGKRDEPNLETIIFRFHSSKFWRVHPQKNTSFVLSTQHIVL